MSSGGFRYCANCEIEMAHTEVACWICGGLMEFVPQFAEGGGCNTAWDISAFRDTGLEANCE